MKRVRIRSFSGSYFPAYGLNTERYSVRISPYLVRMRENTVQKNSEYEHFSCMKFSNLIYQIPNGI